MKRRIVSALLVLCMMLALLPVSALAAEDFDTTTLHYQTVLAKQDDEGHWLGNERADATVVFSSAYQLRADVPYSDGSGSRTSQQYVYVLGPNCGITVSDKFFGTDGILMSNGFPNTEYLVDEFVSYTYTAAGFVRDEDVLFSEGMTGDDVIDILTAPESVGKLFNYPFYDGVAEWTAHIYVAGSGTIPSFFEREKPASWAADDVNTAISLGLVPMLLRDDYSQPITRADFCALATQLYETYTGSEITERKSFDDEYDANVEKMAGLGVVNGVDANHFNPDGTLTREQAATILSRLATAAGKPLTAGTPSFSDKASISSWAADAVGAVEASGIMNGTGNGAFSPKGTFTRTQSILTMLRLFNMLRAK